MDLSGHVEHVAEVTIDPNEASGLLCVQDPALLERFGWDIGLWSVLDEVDVGECIVLLGHERDQPLESGWDATRLPVTRTGASGPASDAESMSAWDGWVYIFGSHHGGKDGPIRREEQWVARFREADVVGDESGGVPGVELAVVDTGFELHRAVNDALRASGIDVLPMTPEMRRAFVDAARTEWSGAAEAERIQPDDWTINIEGITFTPGGTLLLGLRFPVAADGRPLLVEIDNPSALFTAQPEVPRVRRVVAVDAVGRDGGMAGVRDLCVVGDTLHLVTGDLDSAGKGSVIRQDYEGGRHTVSTHFIVGLDAVAGSREVVAEPVAEFPDTPRIEGLACAPDGRFFYVSDEDASVSLRSTPLFAVEP